MIKSPKAKLRFTALHVAAMNNDVNALQKMLQGRSKELNTQDELGLTPLATAVIHGHIESTKLLAQAGADVNIKSLEGHSPLFYAYKSEIITLLKQKGAQDDSAPSNIDIHQAASSGDVRKLKKILKEHPEMLDAQDSQGCTPLHYAVIFKHEEVVVALIEAGADVNILDYEHRPPVAYAQDGKLKSYLEAHGAYHDFLQEEIHNAAIMGNVSDLKSILDANPEKIDIQDSGGNTPLMHCVLHNHLAAAKYLIKRKANVNLLDFQGYSALLTAAATGKKAFVELMLKNGAFIDQITSAQLNIIDLAEVTEEGKKRKALSNYLKSRIALSEQTMESFACQFRAILLREIQQAKAQDKKLLVMLGETHNAYKSMQLEKCLYQVAKDLGINTVLIEQNQDLPLVVPTDLFAQNSLGLRVIGVDNYPYDLESEDVFMDDRNQVMSQEVQKLNCDTILRVGSNHLYGLLEDKNTCINKAQYHVVPFNLTSLLIMEPIDDNNLSRFAANPRRVAQVYQEGISEVQSVSNYWNQTAPSQSFLMRGFFHAQQYLSKGFYSLLGFNNNSEATEPLPNHPFDDQVAFEFDEDNPSTYLIKRKAKNTKSSLKRQKMEEDEAHYDMADPMDVVVIVEEDIKEHTKKRARLGARH